MGGIEVFYTLRLFSAVLGMYALSSPPLVDMLRCMSKMVEIFNH